MARNGDRFSPLPNGSSVELEGVKLTLGPASDGWFPGFGREGRADDGRVFKVFEIRSSDFPAHLDKALSVEGVARPFGRKVEDGRVILALRPAPGPTLEWVLRRGEGLPLHSLRLVRALAVLFDAIAAAGLTFRQISPALFSVAPDGSVALEDPDALRLPTEVPAKAATPYQAPEIVSGADGGPRADLFGLGALAHALITGRLPTGRGDFPLARIFQPKLPHGAIAAISRAMAPLPSDRHESARAFAADLEARTAPTGSSPTTLAAAAATELGRIKGQSMPVNQDAFFVGLDEGARRGMLLVADGVSTADVGSGDLASNLVREATRAAWEGPVGEILRTHKGSLPQEWAKTALKAILEEANARIYAFLKQPIFVGSLGPGTHPPGSTAVLGIIDGDRLTLANVGDSRFYLLRGGAFEQMSVDHDLRTEFIKAGRDPRAVADPGTLGALTQSVGAFSFDTEGQIHARPLEPDFQTLHLRSGDRLLLCSDGVPDCLGEDAEEIMARELADGDDPAAIATRLCKLADEELGADNITALVLLAR